MGSRWSVTERMGGSTRAAPRAESTSDITRFDGLALGLFVMVAVLGLGFRLGTTDPAQGSGASRALMPMHRRAALTCARCHQPGSHGFTEVRCEGCHGERGSTRPGHQRALASGGMTCLSCHREHDGVAVSSQALASGSGHENAGTRSTPDDGLGTVPVIAAERCQACHRSRDTTDPAARCWTQGWSVCFDEHRRITAPGSGTTRASAQRIALWAEARRRVQAHTLDGDESPRWPAWGWILLGLGLGGASTFGWRSRTRVRSSVEGNPDEHRQAVQPPDQVRRPRINTMTCIGCSACVDVCPYDVLELRNYVATVARPDDCCGLTLCAQRCPNGSLVMEAGPPQSLGPPVDERLQSRSVDGLFLAGDLTGLPLIRNAINQGAFAMRSAVESLDRGQVDSWDAQVIVVGAGPAGLSAALQAQTMGIATMVLEQGSVADSIRSFPRGKLVFDQPLGVPKVGDLWLEESTKEALLAQWVRIVRQHGLPVVEDQRVTSVRRQARGDFEIHVDTGSGPRIYRCGRVVLATGRRGTPRHLPIPLADALSHRVHYGLADAASLAGQRVIVVGLGDVAMEAIVALARQPNTSVVVSYRGTAPRRGKRRNIAAVERLVAAERIEMLWNSEIVAVNPDAIRFKIGDRIEERAWDRMLVMIGNVAPWAFLSACGVEKTKHEGRASHSLGVLKGGA